MIDQVLVNPFIHYLDSKWFQTEISSVMEVPMERRITSKT